MKKLILSALVGLILVMNPSNVGAWTVHGSVYHAAKHVVNSSCPVIRYPVKVVKVFGKSVYKGVKGVVKHV